MNPSDYFNYGQQNQLNREQQGIMNMGGLGQISILNPGWPYPQGLPIYKDPRPVRVILEDRIKTNKEAIEYCAKRAIEAETEIKEIEEVLKELDNHPLMEKFNNLIRRITG